MESDMIPGFWVSNFPYGKEYVYLRLSSRMVGGAEQRERVWPSRGHWSFLSAHPASSPSPLSITLIAHMYLCMVFLHLWALPSLAFLALPSFLTSSSSPISNRCTGPSWFFSSFRVLNVINAWGAFSVPSHPVPPRSQTQYLWRWTREHRQTVFSTYAQGEYKACSCVVFWLQSDNNACFESEGKSSH